MTDLAEAPKRRDWSRQRLGVRESSTAFALRRVMGEVFMLPKSEHLHSKAAEDCRSPRPGGGSGSQGCSSLNRKSSSCIKILLLAAMLSEVEHFPCCCFVKKFRRIGCPKFWRICRR